MIARPTRDIDVVALVDDDALVPFVALPGPLQRAVEDTARVLRLPVEWFNPGPRSLMDLGLPNGILKLYAAVDQGPRSKHVADLRALHPTVDELRAAAAWARTHDPSEGFGRELRGALRDLGIVDGVG